MKNSQKCPKTFKNVKSYGIIGLPVFILTPRTSLKNVKNALQVPTDLIRCPPLKTIFFQIFVPRVENTLKTRFFTLVFYKALSIIYDNNHHKCFLIFNFVKFLPELNVSNCASRLNPRVNTWNEKVKTIKIYIDGLLSVPALVLGKVLKWDVIRQLMRNDLFDLQWIFGKIFFI